MEAGADGIEFDVRLCADRHPILLHDSTLDRTTDGSGPVRRWQWEKLRQLDAGSWFSSEFRGQQPVDLGEALRFLRPKVHVVVELKSEAKDDMPLVETVLDHLEATGGIEGVTVSGKRWRLLGHLSRLAPKLDLALTVGSRERRDSVASALEIGASALHVNLVIMTSRLMKHARRAGLEIYTYTINNGVGLNRSMDLGVDGLFSDHPGKIRKLLDRRFG
jgi:glycerophosphoryl diester phosphodiesterase